MPYPIGFKKPEDEFEKMIEEMRNRQREEELQKIQDQRMEAEKLRLLEEQENRKKANKNSGAALPSYDMFGQVVEVAPVRSFPNLTTRCSSNQKSLETVEAKTSRKPFVHIIHKGPRTSNEPWEMEVAKSARLEQDGTRPGLMLQRVYETIVPAMGVTFSEGGKNPKANRGPEAPLSHRLTKAEYATQLVEGTQRASTAVHTLLPTIGRGSQGSKGMLVLPTGCVEMVKPTSVPILGFNTKDMPGTMTMREQPRVQSVRKRERPPAVAIDGDLAQLIAPMTGVLVKPKTPSVVPKPYVPPTYRRVNVSEQHPLAIPAYAQTQVDVFNRNIEDLRSYDYGMKTKPIARGLKNKNNYNNKSKSKNQAKGARTTEATGAVI